MTTTDAMVRAFHPDENTLKSVSQVRQHKPIEVVEVLLHKD